MFWRFGFHNASSIDSLLDKDDVALEALLDEDDLLQECKAQNTRLIDYFQRQDVLKQLFGYVTGQIEPEEGKRFKYPYVATEVLCSDIWSIVETCTNNKDTLLLPFWESVLERTPDDMKTNMVLAANFAKINSVFLNKKPAEMVAFIQSQPDVIDRIIRLIETPAFVDLLVRIIQLDEPDGCDNILEWLSQERLIPRLVELLSPFHSADKHAVVADLLKSITAMANPSPGAALAENMHTGPSSNRFARELVKPDIITQLMGYIIADFGPQTTASGLVTDPPPDPEKGKDNMSWSISSQPPLPTLESHTSSVVSSIAVIVEVIRKNNSDYFEPYLFHVLRNRLMQVQQQLDFSEGDFRQALEPTMQTTVEKFGVVHFGPLLEVMIKHMEQLQGFMKQPRSLTGPVHTTVGTIRPLTLERYRVIELFAELLHCSNMTLLNRSPSFTDMYDADGRLQGGLAGMERLGQVIAPAQRRDDDDNMDDVEPAMELPISSASQHSPSNFDSDDDMGSEPGSSDDEAMEEIVMAEESPASQRAPLTDSPQTSVLSCSPHSSNFSTSPNTSTLSSSPETSTTMASLAQSTESVGSSAGSTAGARSRSRKGSRRRTTMDESVTASQLVPIGEQLKRRWLDLDILSTMMDLFFEFPWNNFLHSAVYDIIHQIFTGPAESPLNRELALSLFRDAKLMHRIVEGQKRNDEATAQPKGVRLGYMGHLTLIAEDVINWLEQLPSDARVAVLQFAPDPAWEEYVNGRFNETKARDTALLGGGKPDVTRGAGGASRWKVDEEDAKGVAAKAQMEESEEALKGEFKRSTSAHPRREGSADFGPAPMLEDDDDEDNERGGRRTEPFARYLAQEIGTTAHFENSSEESDEDEDDGGWLSQGQFMRAPVSSQQRPPERRPLSDGFGDTFDPGPSKSPGAVHSNPFETDEDTFGAFTAATNGSGVSDSDPFTFPSSFPSGDGAGDLSASAFDDDFGDFGDFQSAGTDEPEDGELTPTTGSWTFASSTSSAQSDDEGKADSGSAAEERRNGA